MSTGNSAVGLYLRQAIETPAMEPGLVDREQVALLVAVVASSIDPQWSPVLSTGNSVLLHHVDGQRLPPAMEPGLVDREQGTYQDLTNGGAYTPAMEPGLVDREQRITGASR